MNRYLHWELRWSAVLIACVVLPAVALGGDDTQGPTPEAQAKAAAEKMWNACEAVLDNHMAPPTRQQMLQAGLRGITTRKPNELAADSSSARAISDLVDRAATEQFLAKQFSVASQVSRLPIAQLEAGFISAALSVVPGRTHFIPAKESAVQQQLAENRYVGIGIAAGMVDQYPAMLKVMPRGPAFRAGALDGDLMVSIDGEDTKGMPLENVIPKLRGQGGVPVSIVVRQPKSPETRKLTIVRGEVPFETILGRTRNQDQEWNFAVETTKEVAYVKIESIRGNTVSELRETARKLHVHGFRALILDLRGMENGELRHAAMLADLLLEEGSIGSCVIRSRREDFKSNADNLFPGWPIAVLVDPSTVGQAEWIAASLQQRRNTVLMGSNTLGTGYIVERVKLTDGAAIDLRTGIYLRADGRSLVSAAAGMETGMLFRYSVQLLGRPDSPRPSGAWNGVSPEFGIGNDAITSATAKLIELL